MNHVPSHILSEGARPLTRRAMAKLRTRQALLEAGKQLFTERGYEQATVRDIARAAGMSTGAVFANFTDKSDLFGEILVNDYQALAETMQKVAAGQHATARDALRAVLAAGYDFHMKQLPLLQAALATSWSHTPEEEARIRAGRSPILAVVTDIIQRGVRAKEISGDVDVDLVTDMILTAYRSNYRKAVYDGFGLSELVERMDRQLEVILNAVTVD